MLGSNHFLNIHFTSDCNQNAGLTSTANSQSVSNFFTYDEWKIILTIYYILYKNLAYHIITNCYKILKLYLTKFQVSFSLHSLNRTHHHLFLLLKPEILSYFVYFICWAFFIPKFIHMQNYP